jgi:glycosyltransferase involved in cell wall biosynthesis
MLKKPKVSVCIPAYNHEKYVCQAIKSVLNQGIDDLEIVITDDCSSDSTVSAINSINDNRIRLFIHSHNQGPSVAANNNIKNSQGEYVCFLPSDDIFLPGKIHKQLGVLEANRDLGAVFSHMQYIDEEGSLQERQGGPLLVPEYDKRENILRQFFFEGNYLAAPTAMVRRQVLDQIGLLDPRLLQTQDFDFWIRLCLRFDIRIIREPLVQYRIRSGLANADANTPAKIARIFWELPKVLERFCDFDDAELFFRVFPEACEHAKEGLRLRTLLALVALKAPHRWTRTFGLELLYREFADPEAALALEATGFSYPEFFRAAAHSDASGAAALEDVVAYLKEVIQARDWWHEKSDHWQAECNHWRAQYEALTGR